MNRNLFFASLVFGALLPFSLAFAQSSITFPIAELGNCNSKAECKAYCDDPSHAEACISFGESHGLMSAEEAARARTFSAQTGPGGCMGSACKTYCSDPSHRDECVKFAEEHGLTPPGGKLAPHVKEPQIDEDRAMQVVQEQGGPGGCTTKDECRAYCSTDAHLDECLTFAKEHKLMSEEDIDRAEKFSHQEGPGGCQGIACKAYCEDAEHADECISFAEKNGLIEPAEAKKARTLMNVTGPGGCRGIECKTFCENPDNREACFSFAKEHNLIPPEDAERMEKMMHGPQNEDASGGPNGFGGSSFQGPGGCSSPEECRSFCENNPDACQGFGPNQSQEAGHPVGQERAIQQRGFEVPPGLTQECKQHPEQCREQFQKQMKPSSGERGDFQKDGMDFQMDGPDFQKDGADFQKDGQDFQKDGMNYQRDGADYEQSQIMGTKPGKLNGQGFMPREQNGSFGSQQFQAQKGMGPENFGPMGGQGQPGEMPPGANKFQGEGTGGYFGPPQGEGMMQPPGGGSFQPPPPSGGPQTNAANRFTAAVLSIVMSLFHLQ